MEIVINVTVSVVTSGLATYLFKKLFEHNLIKSIEDYKSTLSLKSEKVKSDLYIYAQDKVRELSKYDAYKSDSLIKLHKIYSEWLGADSMLRVGNLDYNKEFSKDFPLTLNQARKAHQIGMNFSDEMSKNEIFIPKSVYETIRKTCMASITLVAKYLRDLEVLPIEQKNYAWLDPRRDLFEKEYEAIISPLSFQLIQEFRKQFGTE